MGEDLAGANVNRSYALASSSIAIFTFTLFFLYPRFVSGEANAVLFQTTIIVMALATFSFVFASFHYYRSSLAARTDDDTWAAGSRRGDRFWLLGCLFLFLAPSTILFSLSLFLVGSVWFGLWLVFLIFMIRSFPSVRS